MRRVYIGAALIGAFVLLGPGTAANAATRWQALHRPIDLPHISQDTECPISQVDDRVDWSDAHIFGGSGTGRGPVYPGLGSEPVGHINAEEPSKGRTLFGGKVFWYATPDYLGRALIRGRRIDGPGRLHFSSGSPRISSELKMRRKSANSWSGQPEGSRGMASGVYAPRSGCYAVQIDGKHFSRKVVFKVSTP